MIAACMVDKFELPRQMGGRNFPFAKVTMHAASGIRFHQGNAWPTGPIARTSGGNFRLPLLAALFLPFHAPAGTIGLSRRDDRTDA
jgi:hypothetical protein